MTSTERLVLYRKVLIALIAAPATACPFDCPVTTPDDLPNPAVPMGDSTSHAWYGSNLLAAKIPRNGIWTGMGRSANYRDKFWWWREGYSAHEETEPNLEISILRLDGPDQQFRIQGATNAFGYNEDWHSMLIGMEFPSEGCWEIRGRYNEREELTIVVEVRDEGASK